MRTYSHRKCEIFFINNKVTVKTTFDINTKRIREIPFSDVVKGSDRLAPSFMNRKFGTDASVFEVKHKPHSFRVFKF